MTATEDARRRLATLSDRVGAARARLAQGETVDLSGLETEARATCEAITRTGGTDAGALTPLVTILLDDLDKLGAALARQHKELGAKLGQLNTRQQAARAYITASGPKR